MTGEAHAGSDADYQRGPGAPASRLIRVVLHREWAPPRGRGLLAADPRIRTLRKVLVTYPDVRHVQPDRIALATSGDDRVIDTVVRFLQRQHWLVKSVIVE